MVTIEKYFYAVFLVFGGPKSLNPSLAKRGQGKAGLNNYNK